MTSPEQLIERAAGAIAGQYDGHSAAAWRSDAEAVVDALFPQVTTPEQLAALPNRSKLLDTNGTVYVAWRCNCGCRMRLWGTTGRTLAGGSITSRDLSDIAEKFGPLTVIWQPEADQ